jgi:hypothetical protein
MLGVIKNGIVQLIIQSTFPDYRGSTTLLVPVSLVMICISKVGAKFKCVKYNVDVTCW